MTGPVDHVDDVDDAWRDDDPAESTPQGPPEEGVNNGSTGSSMGLVTLSGVTPEEVVWMWPGYIPLKKLSIWDGDPGIGKSTVTADIAARVSRGWAMPDGTRGTTLPHGVLIINGEDSISDTILPRILAAGGDTDRVHVLPHVEVLHSVTTEDPYGDNVTELVAVKEHPVIPTHVPQIRQLIFKHDIRLLIIDPLDAHLADGTDSYKGTSMRRALQPLVDLAARLEIAVVLVRHPKKGDGSAMHKGSGSVSIIGLARMGLYFAEHPDDPERRVIACTKTNNGKKPPSLTFSFKPTDTVATIEWGGTIDVSADQLAAPSVSREAPATDAAAEFLEDLLADGKRLGWNEIVTAGRAEGVSATALTKAKKRLALVKQRDGFQAPVTWSLPLLDPPPERNHAVAIADPLNPIVDPLPGGQVDSAAVPDPNAADEYDADRIGGLLGLEAD